jgi:hypothetical protein
MTLPAETPAAAAEMLAAEPETDAVATMEEADESSEDAQEIVEIVPVTPRRRQNGWQLATITAISFSLTFVGVSIALLFGVLPPAFASIQPPVDLGVVMLMVPLCALVFTMLAEVLRAAIKGLPRIRAPRPTPALSTWRPGHGEG